MDDILLGDLAIIEHLSKESITICKKNRLISLLSIIDFFQSEENNYGIERMNPDVRSELRKLCKKHFKQDIFQSEEKDIPLQRLDILENMSQRAMNVCISAGLKSLKEILKIGQTHSGFLCFRNCGSKSNEELMNICKKYDNLTLDYSIEEIDTLQDGKGQLTINLAENIDLLTLAGIEDISVRSYNVCIDAGLNSLRRIIQYYYNNRRNGFLSIRNCGNKSNRELIKICLKYEKLISSIQNGNSIENDFFSPIDTFLNSLGLPGGDYKKVKDSIVGLDFIPLFKMLNLIIDSNFVFRNENTTIIFKDTFNFYLPPVNITLAEVGKRLGLTRERVRQIHETIYRRLFQGVLGFIKFGKILEIFPGYIPSTDQPIILINDEDTEKINKNENTNFSPLFIAFVLSEILNDNFLRVGDCENLFSRTACKKRCFSKNLYLVNRKIASQFQFDLFLKYVHSLLCQSRKEDDYITYNEILVRFTAGNITEDQIIVKVINIIMNNDYQQFVEIKPNGLNFYRTRKRNLTSYMIEILQNSDKPLHYSEIHRQLVSQGISVTSEQSSHSMLNRESEIFGLKGAGIFDIKSKGGLFGTIGDVAEQILKVRNAPIPLQTLENLICNELFVSKNSIQTVLFSYSNEVRFERDRNGDVKLKE